MRRRAAALLACAAWFAACDRDGSEPGGFRAGPVADPPDVLFVSLDTLGARHLSLYGYPRPTSPALDAFASDAVVFEQAWANAPWTLPSYLSQFSGLYPDAFRRDGAGDREGLPGGGPRFRLPEERLTLAEAFLEAGYRTAAWIDTPWLGLGSGFQQGFESVDLSAALAPLGTPQDGLEGLLPKVTGWWAEESHRPSFAFVHAIDVHAPYALSAHAPDSLPGEPFVPPRDEVALTDVGGMYDTVHRHVLLKRDLEGRELSAGDAVGTRELADRYDRGIAGVDRLLGELLETLDADGLLDDAVVIVSSDHGEALGHHDWYFDHALVHEATLHVPLVVRMPRAERIEGARGRVAATVQLVDLFPTLAELCGLEEAPSDLEGRSLVRWLHDPAGPESGEREPVLAQGTMHVAAAVRLGRWKLVRRDLSQSGLQTLASHPRGLAVLAEREPALFAAEPAVADLLAREGALAALLPHHQALSEALGSWTTELYDLERDPEELADVAAEHDDVVQELQAVLLERLARIDAQRAVHLRWLAGDGGQLDELERERLIELGYLDAEQW